MKYYDFEVDLKTYPDAWCYIIYSGRNTGKTYSTLKCMYKNKYAFGFTKRTNDDVDILCKADRGLGAGRINLSPWQAIERDNPGISIITTKVMKGIGAFHHRSIDGQPEGDAVGYVFSLNAIGDIKGFNYDADFLIFDEFIPKPWERVNRKEGDQLLDLYKTLDRDRIHRGKKPTKLVCLANATEINNPVFSVLELVDDIAMLDQQDSYVYYDRGIMIRKVNDQGFHAEEINHPMYERLKDTQWGQMAFEGSFAYNDFSLVRENISIKGAQPYCSLIYKRKHYYIYIKGGKYLATTSAFNKECPCYNLDRETEVTRYWLEVGYALRLEAVEGNVLFKTYTLYDIIYNFRRIFKV